MKTTPKYPKRSLKSKQVVEKFKDRGIHLSESEAEEYLDLLYFLAGLVVKQNFLSPTNEKKIQPKQATYNKS